MFKTEIRLTCKTDFKFQRRCNFTMGYYVVEFKKGRFYPKSTIELRTAGEPKLSETQNRKPISTHFSSLH